MGFVAVVNVDGDEDGEEEQVIRSPPKNPPVPSVTAYTDDDCEEEASAVIKIPPKTAPPPPKAPATKRGSRKANRSGSNVYSGFSDKQLAEFKEAFKFMDEDKDGILGMSDLRATYNAIGSRPPSEEELREMLREGSGPMNLTMLLSLFADKLSGPADEDDIIYSSFKSYDKNGTIDSESLRLQLMTFGDKFTEEEVDNVFDNLDIDHQGRFDTSQIIELVIGRSGEPEAGQQVEEEVEPDEEVTFSL